MGKLSQLTDAVQRALHGNVSLTRGVLAIGSTTSQFSTTAAVLFAIGGIIRNFPLTASTALATGGDPFRVQPANTTVYYVLGLDASATPKVFQGRYAGEVYLSPTGMSLVGDGSVPDIPDTFAPFGMLKVALGATTFTPGTTALNAANVTTTFYDLHNLPVADRP